MPDSVVAKQTDGASVTDPEETVLTFGKYRVIDELGSGAMGVVYRARHPDLPFPRALKVLREDLVENTETVARFREEGRSAVRAAGTLNHPNIVTVYDVGEESRRPYIVMELFHGEPLDQLMPGIRQWALEDVLSVAAQLADALDSAHRHGVIHRDVKPANILVSEDHKTAKLTDFSVARAKSDSNLLLTMTGTVIGAPRYMSPEQALGKELDGRADLYSLGIVLFELLTGQKAYKSDTITALLIEITQSDRPAVRTIRPNIPLGVERIVSKLLEKEPAERFQTGEELAEALRREIRYLGENRTRDAKIPAEVKGGLLFALISALVMGAGSMVINTGLTRSIERQAADIGIANAQSTAGAIYYLEETYRDQMLDSVIDSFVKNAFAQQASDTGEGPEIEYALMVEDNRLVARSDDRFERNAPYRANNPVKVVRQTASGISASIVVNDYDGASRSARDRQVLEIQVPMPPDPITGVSERRFILGLPTDQLRATSRLAGLLFSLMTLLSAATVGLITFLVTKRFTRPLQLMRNGMRNLRTGDLGIRMPASRSGIIGQTFKEFNAMAASFDRRGTTRDEDEHRPSQSPIEADTTPDPVAEPPNRESTEADDRTVVIQPDHQG